MPGQESATPLSQPQEPAKRDGELVGVTSSDGDITIAHADDVIRVEAEPAVPAEMRNAQDLTAQVAEAVEKIKARRGSDQQAQGHN